MTKAVMKLSHNITQLEKEELYKYIDGNFTFSTKCMKLLESMGLQETHVMDALSSGEIQQYYFSDNRNFVVIKGRMRVKDKFLFVTLQVKSRRVVDVYLGDQANLVGQEVRLDILKNMKKYA